MHIMQYHAYFVANRCFLGGCPSEVCFDDPIFLYDPTTVDELMICSLPPRIHPYLLSRISPKQFNPLESQDMIMVS